VRALLTVILCVVLASGAQAQRPHAGHTHYGPPQTISCLQGGQVVIQYAYAWAVDYTWSDSALHLEFRDVDDVPRVLDLNSQAITCLIEPYGQASVPIRPPGAGQ
jgi:hypothetical protein